MKKDKRKKGGEAEGKLLSLTFNAKEKVQNQESINFTEERRSTGAKKLKQKMSEHGKPTDGMCCLCTMEDITEEDGNYGKFLELVNHGSLT